MRSGVNDALGAGNGRGNFGLLAQEVFSLDAAIQWVALEEAGREPRWVWRDRETGRLHGGMTKINAELVDPLLLMLAEGHDDLYSPEAITNPHRLLFVVLAYADLVQIMARFGPDVHVGVAIDRRADAYALGMRLSSLLQREAQERLLW